MRMQIQRPHHVASHSCHTPELTPLVEDEREDDTSDTPTPNITSPEVHHEISAPPLVTRRTHTPSLPSSCPHDSTQPPVHVLTLDIPQSHLTTTRRYYNVLC